MAQLELFPADPVSLVGDPHLVSALREVIRAGFSDRLPAGTGEVEVRWNPRLRSTVGRVLFRRIAVIEISPGYHEAHPGELVETLTHEYAHVLQPGQGHGAAWRREFLAALEQQGLEPPPDLLRARNRAPGSGRYLWLCTRCETAVGSYSRRRRDEVASRSLCCAAPVQVLDRVSGDAAPPRDFHVGCRRCGFAYAAYDDRRLAMRFARRHRCRCGGRLRVAGPFAPEQTR